MDSNRKIRVGITHGDINGIGYEVILKTLEDSQICELCTPVVYGSSKSLSYHRKALNMPNVNFNLVTRAEDAVDNVNNLVEVISEEVKIELGRPSEVAGKAAFASLKRAAEDLRNGIIDVLVTAPINKDTIRSEEFHFNGHTEYLESAIGEGNKSLMILCNDNLRVALVTTHLPLSKVPEAITKDAIIEKLKIFDESLRKDFDIQKPKIAVLALNPHAGENGLLGTEEKEVITLAIEEAYNEAHIMCFGPYAADGFFGSGQFSKFDGVLAMYHDQGLAPFKTIAMESGVNFTAGLPYVRTSPDHGTGYDITGKNIADESSFRSAIYKAIDIFRNRTRYYEMRENPLRRQYFDKSGDKEVLDLTKDDGDDTPEIIND